MASGPITSWQIDGEKVETMTDYFLGFWNHCDSHCSHEIKTHLLLGRKAMTKLDSILKSRDITLLTKVCIVKAMVFPVVRYRCEIWTIKKAECWTTDGFWTVEFETILGSPLGSKEIKLVNPKGNQPWLFIGRTDAEAEVSILWPQSWLAEKKPWCWERLKAKEEGGRSGGDG